MILTNYTYETYTKSDYFRVFFEELRYYLNPLFQYKQGNCHNLMHYGSLILEKYGVKHQKIWIFAPSKYKENEKTLIQLPDPNNIAPSGILSWSFHVALLVKNDNEEFVFDYFIDENAPLSVSQWIEKMQLKTFHCEVQPTDFYLFYTNPSEKKKNGVFSGNYFGYEDKCLDEYWLPKGLAVNETAIHFFKAELNHFVYTTDKSTDYRLLVGSINNFECIFRDNSFNKKVNPEFQEKHQEIIQKYRKEYELNLEKWIEKVDNFL